MPLKLLRCAVTLALLLAAATLPAQTTRTVGSGQSYATIQSAMDAAQAGDTVLVAPGTYYENIDFHGKAITVTSANGPAQTTIDGSQTAPVALFRNGETRSAVLSGFTLQHGGSPVDLPGVIRGGVNIYRSSPTLRNNILTQNNCWTIYTTTAAPLIQNNQISATRDPHGTCSFGGGAAIFTAYNLNFSEATNDGSAALITGNTIENNVESGMEDAGGNGGAGIAVWGGSPVILSNTLRNNASPGGSGGAINVESGQGVSIVGNLIYGNSAGCGGGALAFFANPDPRTGLSVLIANNTIVNNTGQGSAGYTDCTPIAQIYPSPDTYGQTTPAALLLNNIISGSTANPAINCALSGFPSEATEATLQSNLLFNSLGPFFGSLCVDVSGRNNNIAADPQLISPSTGDFHLQSSSPALDHGPNNVFQLFNNLTGLTLTTDLDGNPRSQDTTGNGCTIDIGAYEYTGTKGICGTTLNLTAALNPSPFGQTVTFTAQLASPNGIPTGSVQFSDGNTVLGTATVSASGVATLSSSQLAVGSHVITAAYQPSGNFGQATSTVTAVILGLPTTLTLTSSADPALTAQPVTFTATLTAQGGSPGGTITFTDGDTPLSTIALSAGTASYSTSSLSIGLHSLHATYTPTGNFAAASALLVEQIYGQATATTLAVSPNPVAALGTLTLTATVTSATGTPTGIVDFYSSNTIKLGSAPLNSAGVATFSTTAPAPGTYSLVATYAGDAVYLAGTGPAVLLTTLGLATSTALTASPNPASIGQPVLLSATVASPSGQVPTGTITFSEGTSLLGSAPVSASGSATLSLGTLAPGVHSLSATYAGTGLFTASASQTVQETILPGTFTVTLTPASLTLHAGQQATTMVALASLGGFSGPLVLAIGNAPTYARATLDKPSLTLASGGLGNATLQFTTVAESQQTAAIPGSAGQRAALAAVVALLLPFGLPRRRRSPKHPLLLLLLAVAFACTGGCTTIALPYHVTAPGQYTLPITATDSNGNSHTANLQITVLP